MVFASPIFLFLFLPVALALNFLLPRRARNLFLMLVSIWFYSWGELRFLWVMAASTILDYSMGLLISGGWRGGEIPFLPKGGPRTAVQRLGLAMSIVGNLTLLGVFKYFHFFVDNWNAAAMSAGLPDWVWQPAIQIALPLGISFFTFQTMSYTIDVFRGEVRATRNIIDYGCFVTMFHQLVAGPIVRYADISRELRERRETLPEFCYGVKRFAVGLAKKVLIANTVAFPADRIFALPDDQITTGMAWLAVACYTLQIYYDFSGYSDMAIGMGHMYGFRFLENFNHPYTARSITDFWRRWHMSLSTWFRDYLYIPLGGNRLGMGRTYVNLVIVFFLCGLWHGAAWTFVFWGLYHGTFLVLERLRGGRVVSPVHPVIAHVYTMSVVVVGWVLFRSETLGQAFTMLTAMAGFAPGLGLVYNTSMFATPDVLAALVVGALFAGPTLAWVRDRAAHLTERASERSPLAGALMEGTWSTVTVLVVLALVLGSMMQLSAGTHNPFIYYRF